MVSTIQSSFNAGELSPRMLGRVDNKFYFNGSQSCLNFTPFVQGGLTKRVGTYFTAEVKTSSLAVRLIPFKFSTTQNYVLEFGNLYFRVYRNRGRVESPPGTPVEFVTPWATADLQALKFTQSADVLYVFHPNYQTRKITRTNDTTWTVTTVTWIDGPWMDLNSTTTALTPSATTGAGVTITASSIVGINGGAGFKATDVGRQIRIKHIVATVITWGYATITAFTDTTHVTVTVNSAFTATTASADWRLGAFSDTTGYPSVGAFHQQRLVLAATPSQPQTIWGSLIGNFETFSPTISVSGGTGNNNITDDSGYTFTINDDQVNAIYWLSSGRVLDIGTAGGGFSMYSGTSDQTAAVTPTNVQIRRQVIYGSAPYVRAKRVGSLALFVDDSQQIVYDYQFDVLQEIYKSEPLSLLSEHILKPQIVDFDFAYKPEPLAWFVMGDGTMVTMTYNQSQEVKGFTRHTIGGTGVAVESICVIPSPDKKSDDVWLSVKRTINGSTKRYIEYIGSPFSAKINGQQTAFFVDCGLTYDGRLAATVTPGATTGTGVTFTAGSAIFSAGDVGKQIVSGAGRALITAFTDSTHVVANVTVDFASTSTIAQGAWSLAVKTVSGLSHLEGQTVGALGDFAVLNDAVVSSGSVTYPSFYSYINVGLKFSAGLIGMPEEVAQMGTIQGKKYRINRWFARVFETTLLRFLNSRGAYELIDYRPNSTVYGQAQAAFSGLTKEYMVGSYDYAATIELASIDPTPCTILFIEKDFQPNG